MKTREMESRQWARYKWLIYTKQQHARGSDRNGLGHCCAHATGYGDRIPPSKPVTASTDKVPLCLIYSELQHARGCSRHGQNHSST